MTKLERRRLVALIRKLDKKSHQANAWIKKNFHRCGHSDTDDSLGDEGWMQAHHLGGQLRAYEDAAYMLAHLVKQFKVKKG